MDKQAESSKLSDKLMEPLEKIVKQHSANILPLLQGGTETALRNDDTVRTVATYCYALLPGLVRLAVKEPAFIAFVLANREKVLGNLIASQAAPAK